MQHPFSDNELATSLAVPSTLGMNEYLLVIQPDESVYQKIMAIKQSFAATYDCPSALYSKPHITLINFLQWDMLEKKVIPMLQRLTATVAPFSVRIENFGSFPTHTIYAAVQTKNDIVQLVKSLKPAQSLLTLNKDNKPHFIIEPHLTIARKLLPWQFEKAWQEYSNTPFSAGFMVHQVVLLKRKMGTTKYQVAVCLPLLNKPSNKALQIALF
jgi:2'-5' RNA ligase